MCLGRWCACSCNVRNFACFTSAMLRFHSLRSHPSRVVSVLAPAAPLPPLRSYLSLCSNYVRFMSRCSIPLALFSPCLASFTHCACGSIRHSARGLASRRSLRLRLHSLRSARGRFRFYHIFHKSRPISREIRAEWEGVEPKQRGGETTVATRARVKTKRVEWSIAT